MTKAEKERALLYARRIGIAVAFILLILLMIRRKPDKAVKPPPRKVPETTTPPAVLPDDRIPAPDGGPPPGIAMDPDEPAMIDDSPPQPGGTVTADATYPPALADPCDDYLDAAYRMPKDNGCFIMPEGFTPSPGQMNASPQYVDALFIERLKAIKQHAIDQGLSDREALILTKREEDHARAHLNFDFNTTVTITSPHAERVARDQIYWNYDKNGGTASYTMPYQVRAWDAWWPGNPFNRVPGAIYHYRTNTVEGTADSVCGFYLDAIIGQFANDMDLWIDRPADPTTWEEHYRQTYFQGYLENLARGTIDYATWPIDIMDADRVRHTIYRKEHQGRVSSVNWPQYLDDRADIGQALEAQGIYECVIAPFMESWANPVRSLLDRLHYLNWLFKNYTSYEWSLDQMWRAQGLSMPEGLDWEARYALDEIDRIHRQLIGMNNIAPERRGSWSIARATPVLETQPLTQPDVSLEQVESEYNMDQAIEEEEYIA